MDKVIKVEVKRVYGNDLVYIRSSHKDAVNQLTGKKTVNTADIKALRSLGLTVEVNLPELPQD
jgi:hypothetical protein